MDGARRGIRAQSFGGQSLQPIAFGLSGSPQLDFVAITWSDGVLQTELALAPGPVRQIDETQRQLSSCPVLFAFDGRHFAFVTDLLGVGGHRDPDEPWHLRAAASHARTSCSLRVCSPFVTARTS